MKLTTMLNTIAVLIHSAKYLETLAKILHFITYSCSLLKDLIRSCLLLFHTDVMNLILRVAVESLINSPKNN